METKKTGNAGLAFAYLFQCSSAWALDEAFSLACSLHMCAVTKRNDDKAHGMKEHKSLVSR